MRFCEKGRTEAEGKDPGSGVDPARRWVFGPVNRVYLRINRTYGYALFKEYEPKKAIF